MFELIILTLVFGSGMYAGFKWRDSIAKAELRLETKFEAQHQKITNAVVAIKDIVGKLEHKL